ncbi:unnamed protein product [Spirodela intermedia]|uniref:Uncharacterized protein n=1 Tax=Spirodela intermedia TaxID=51605 RepID=A0A7I8KXB3_SPIIN|nr:unnamed protein product [Spirodela intermedia]
MQTATGEVKGKIIRTSNGTRRRPRRYRTRRGCDPPPRSRSRSKGTPRTPPPALTGLSSGGEGNASSQPVIHEV